jgi:ABC-type multidrug transport system fused ATPase/permease subunit
MFRLTSLSQSYFKFWMHFITFKNKAHLLSVDFHQPWWKIITDQKIYFFAILIAEAIDNAFYTLIPLFIGFLIASQKLYYFFIFMAAWGVTICIEFFALYLSAILQRQSIHSLLYYAHRFFLTVDPIYHATRSSGKIIGKIERGVNAYEDLLDVITFDLLPTVIGIITVTLSFLKFDIFLGILAFSMIMIIGAINIFLQLLSTQAFEPQVITASDKLASINIENLAQINYIRSCFASNETDTLLKNTNLYMMYVGGTSWVAFSALTLFTRLSYLISILVLGTYLIHLIQQQQVSIVMGTALLMTYITGSYEIMRLGKKIKKFLKCTTRINDLFNFIRSFGKQSFPVLSTETPAVSIPLIEKPVDALVVKVKNLHFNYTTKTHIFENHSLFLEISRNHVNKLYGIIGPSGIGKTTLISILGGQLHPSQGSVMIQDVDIYSVDDFTRKYIVALQGQTASSLRGSIRYNLLFGLPKDMPVYEDAALISVLTAVGLWSLFEEKEGLDSLVGESGLNLSGGQRQRLNFANLYLRAKYFNPALILIDEPTSSLDEVSEKAITNMINELAQHAITFVIAHRLNTLEQAVGILDFSLIYAEKNMLFHTRDELYRLSPYYKKLVDGEIQLA